MSYKYRSTQDRFYDYYRLKYGEKASHQWDNYNPAESIKAISQAQAAYEAGVKSNKGEMK